MIKVQNYKDDGNLLETKYLTWPQNYNSFIQDITNNFKLKNNTSDIILKLIDENEDEIKISSKKDFEDYIKEKNIQEFIFYVKEEKAEAFSEQELIQLLEKNVIDDEEIDLNIDNIMEYIWDNEGYKAKMKKDEIYYSKLLKEKLEKNVNHIFESKLKNIQEEINSLLSNYNKDIHLFQKKEYNLLLDLKDGMLEIKDDSLEVKNGLSQLIDYINQGKNILKNNNDNFEDIKIYDPNPIEDPIQIEQEKATQIYEELKIEFNDNINLIEKEEIIDKLMNNNFDKDEIKDLLNTQIEKINNEKAEKCFKKLNLHQSDITKDEIMAKIKEQNFDVEKVQHWINEKVTEKIYEILRQSDEVDIGGANEEEVKEKINELNFNVDEIIIFFAKKDYDEGKVEELYQFLVEDYGVNNVFEEEVVKEKIKELKCNKDSLIAWIENYYSS